MSSLNGLRMARRKTAESAMSERISDDDRAMDALTARLHGLYDSIAQEPIPDSLLDLLRRLK